MRRLAVLALALVTACGSFLSQTHTLSLAFKAGDSYKYSMHVALDYKIGAQGLSLPFQLDLTGKSAVIVRSVDANGVADVTIQLTDLTLKTTIAGTTDSKLAQEVSVNAKIGPDGQVVRVDGKTVPAGSLPDFTGSGGGLLSAILPTGEVKTGDTWTKSYDVDNPAGSGTVHVATDNKYVRDEKVGGADAAVIESKITSTLDTKFDPASLGSLLPARPSGDTSTDVQSIAMKGTITSDITSWIDIGGRRLVKSHSSGSTDATLTINIAAGATMPGLTGPITFQGTQTVDLNPA